MFVKVVIIVFMGVVMAAALLKAMLGRQRHLLKQTLPVVCCLGFSDTALAISLYHPAKASEAVLGVQMALYAMSFAIALYIVWDFYSRFKKPTENRGNWRRSPTDSRGATRKTDTERHRVYTLNL